MAKRWTMQEDAMLLAFADAVGADRVASHDLGRPAGAGSKRLAHLIATGAAESYAFSKVCHIDYALSAGLFMKNSDGDDMAHEERTMWVDRAQKWGADAMNRRAK